MWQFQCTKSDRLDRALREQGFSGAEWLSRAAWDWLFEHGCVRVNGRKALKNGTNLNAGDAVVVNLPAALGLLPAPEQATPVWESSRWGVFAKPAGTDTVALLPWDQSAFASRIAAHRGPSFAALASPPGLEGGLVQRLDRDTSGLVTAAYDAGSKEMLRELFGKGAVEKTYEALVMHAPSPGDHRIWLASETGARVRSWASPPKEKAEEVALTVEVYKTSRAGAWLRVRTRFGRRHVVRASLTALGAPLVGDALYGGSPLAPFHQLHASRLLFPFSPEYPELFEVSPPETFLACAGSLGLH